MMTNHHPFWQPLGLKKSNSKNGLRLALISDSRCKAEPTAHQMASKLTETGFEVSLFDLTLFDGPPDEPHFQNVGQNQNPFYETHYLHGRYTARNWYPPMHALVCYESLKSEHYDYILFQHGFSAAYYCIKARQLGIAFLNTPIIILPDWPYERWLDVNNFSPSAPRTDAEVFYMEQASIEQADALVVCDKRGAEWINKKQFHLPHNLYSFTDDDHDTDCENVFLSLSKTNIPPHQHSASISICCYIDDASYADRIISSLINQSVELLIYDATENDDIIQKFLPLFKEKKWHWHKADKTTLNSAWNYLANYSNGTHLLFLEEDDLPASDIAELFYTAATISKADFILSVDGLNPENDVSQVAVAKIDARQSSGFDKCLISSLVYGPVHDVLLHKNTLGHTVLIKRSAFENFKTSQETDTPFLLKDLLYRGAAHNASFEIIPEVLCLSAHDKEFLHKNETSIVKARKSSLNALINNSTSDRFKLSLTSLAKHSLDNNNHPGRYPDPDAFPKNRVSPASIWNNAKNIEAIPQIVFCASHYFARPLSVALASLWQNTNKVDVHVLTSLLPEQQSKIQLLAKTFNATDVHFINITDDNSQNLPLMNLYGMGKSSATYWRFLIADLLPNLSRVLYLDSDVLCRHDITSLWEKPLNQAILGAVPDGYLATLNPIANKLNGDYFNAGILLIDLDKWRKENISSRAFSINKELTKESEQFKYGDQTALNMAIHSRWKSLSPTWNYSPIELTTDRLSHFRLSLAQYQAISKDPSIVHFLTSQKPWNEGAYIEGSFALEYRMLLKTVDKITGFIDV